MTFVLSRTKQASLMQRQSWIMAFCYFLSLYNPGYNHVKIQGAHSIRCPCCHDEIYKNCDKIKHTLSKPCSNCDDLKIQKEFSRSDINTTQYIIDWKFMAREKQKQTITQINEKKNQNRKEQNNTQIQDITKHNNNKKLSQRVMKTENLENRK